jgi:hypothetical protein
MLLAIGDGASRERLRSVLSARPEAIVPYLTSEEYCRRGRYADASAAFVAAHEADTTFAIAALRVFLGNAWTFDDPIPGPWLERAWAHRAGLSGTDSLLLLAAAGEQYPAPMPMRARVRSLETIAGRSNTAEVWSLFADHLFHNREQLEEVDPLGRALAAFQRALRCRLSIRRRRLGAGAPQCPAAGYVPARPACGRCEPRSRRRPRGAGGRRTTRAGGVAPRCTTRQPPARCAGPGRSRGAHDRQCHPGGRLGAHRRLGADAAGRTPAGQAVRVRALRATAEPALQPEVTQARARLAELGTRVW